MRILIVEVEDERRLAETASRLLTERKLSLEPLIAHRGSFESFAQAVRDIARNAMPGKVLLIP